VGALLKLRRSRAVLLSVQQSNAGCDERDDECRANNQDSNRVERPPDKHKTMLDNGVRDKVDGMSWRSTPMRKPLLSKA